MPSRRRHLPIGSRASGFLSTSHPSSWNLFFRCRERKEKKTGGGKVRGSDPEPRIVRNSSLPLFFSFSFWSLVFIPFGKSSSAEEKMEMRWKKSFSDAGIPNRPGLHMCVFSCYGQIFVSVLRECVDAASTIITLQSLFSSATSFFFSPWKFGAKDRRIFWSTFESRINASEMPKVTPLTKHGVVSKSCFLTSHSRPKNIMKGENMAQIRDLSNQVSPDWLESQTNLSSVWASNNSKKRRRFAIQRVTFGPKTALDFCPINSNFRGLGGKIDGFISFERLSQSIKSWKSVRRLFVSFFYTR